MPPTVIVLPVTPSPFVESFPVAPPATAFAACAGPEAPGEGAPTLGTAPDAATPVTAFGCPSVYATAPPKAKVAMIVTVMKTIATRSLVAGILRLFFLPSCMERRLTPGQRTVKTSRRGEEGETSRCWKGGESQEEAITEVAPGLRRRNTSNNRIARRVRHSLIELSIELSRTRFRA